MKINKKAEIPVIKTLIILVFTGIILILLMLILFNGQKFELEEQKIKKQLVENIILQKNCFGENYGFINSSMFTEDSLKKCLGSIEKEGVAIRIFIDGTQVFYDEKRYNREASFCAIKGASNKCFTQKYPVIYQNNNEEYQRTMSITTVFN